MRKDGQYPAPGTTPEWDEVLHDKKLLGICEMFHCLPSQLDGEDYHLMERLYAISAAEARYRADDALFKSRRPRTKRA